jgi:hypothetical protein
MTFTIATFRLQAMSQNLNVASPDLRGRVNVLEIVIRNDIGSYG